MRVNVQLKIQAERVALHRWPAARNFLKESHRHRFQVIGWFAVREMDRQLEFFELQTKLGQVTEDCIPDQSTLSCEQMAYNILEKLRTGLGLPAVRISVSEDGENAAVVEYVDNSSADKVMVLVSGLSFTGKSTVSRLVSCFLPHARMIEVSGLAEGVDRIEKAKSSRLIRQRLCDSIEQCLADSKVRFIVISGLRELSLFRCVKNLFERRAKLLTYWIECEEKERRNRALLSYTRKLGQVTTVRLGDYDTFVNKATLVDAMLKVNLLRKVYTKKFDTTANDPAATAVTLVEDINQEVAK